MRQRIIAVNSNTYHTFNLDEAIAGIRASGFHYIELTATKGWTEHVYTGMTFEQLCRIKEKLVSEQLNVIALSGHCNLADRARLCDFTDNIRLAAFFNARYIVSSAGEAHLQNSVESIDRTVVENVRNLLPELKEYRLQLVLEVHGEYGTGSAIDKLVKKIGSPLVSINYDTANAIFYGNVDPAPDLKAVVSDVAYLHIKDKAGEHQEWNFPAPGKGYVNFPDLFTILDQAKNNAPLSVEIEFTKQGPKDIDEVNLAVKDAAEYLTSLGYKL